MSSLSHHGIKGQRWGVRRFQNKDGTLTAAGRKRQQYLIEVGSGKRKRLVEAAKPIGTSGDYSRDVTGLNKRGIRGRVINEDDNTHIIKKGTSIYRTATNSELNDDGTYGSLTKNDVDRYIDYGRSGDLPGADKSNLDSMKIFEFSANRDLKIANGKYITEIITDDVKRRVKNGDADQVKLGKEILESFKRHEEDLNLSFSISEMRRSKEAYSRTEKEKEFDLDLRSKATDRLDLYDKKIIDYASGKDYRVIRDRLKREGYDGFIDIEDVSTIANLVRGGANTEYPVVILNANDVLTLKRSLKESETQRRLKRGTKFNSSRGELDNVVQHTSIGGTMYIEGNALILGDSSYLEHHGIKGQRWGVRRFQNKDGTRTAAGKKRYSVEAVDVDQTRGEIKNLVKRFSKKDKEMFFDKHHPDGEYDKSSVDDLVERGVAKRFVVKEGKNIVGFIDAEYSGRVDSSSLNVVIGVDKSARGKGYASILSKKLVDWYDSEGYRNTSQLEWNAYDENVGSKKAAEKAGFKQINDDFDNTANYVYGKNKGDIDNLSRLYKKQVAVGKEVDTKINEAFKKTTIGKLSPDTHIEAYGRSFTPFNTELNRYKSYFVDPYANRWVKKRYSEDIDRYNKTYSEWASAYEKYNKKLKAKHTSIGGTMYIEGNALILGDSSYLEHHGIKGQRWGVRRFQNRDGTLTNAGRKRLGYATKGVAQTVGKAFKAGVKAGGNAVKAVKAHHEKKEAEKLQKKKEKASKTRLGVMANKDLFTNEEIRKLNDRFKLEDEMKMATLQKGVEIAKAVGTIAQNVGTVAKTYEDVTGQSLSPVKRKAAEEKARQDKEDRERRIAREDAEEARKAAKEERDIAIHEQTLRKAIASADTQEFTAQKTKAEADSSILDAIKKGQDFNGGSDAKTDATGKSWVEKATSDGKNPFDKMIYDRDPDYKEAKDAHDEKVARQERMKYLDERIAAREKEKQAEKEARDQALRDKINQSNEKTGRSKPNQSPQEDKYDDDGGGFAKLKEALPFDKGRYVNRKAAEKARDVKENAEEERTKKQDEKAAKAAIDTIIKDYQHQDDTVRSMNPTKYDREVAASVIKGKAKNALNKVTHPVDTVAKKISDKAREEKWTKERAKLFEEYQDNREKLGTEFANEAYVRAKKQSLQNLGYRGEALDKKLNETPFSKKKKAKHDAFSIQNGVLFVDSSDYLSHHGVKGQRWGVRRFQNEDGSLTEKGRKHYEKALAKEKRKQVSSDAIRGTLERQHPFAVAASVALGATYAAMLGVASAAAPGAVVAGAAIAAAISGVGTHGLYSVSEAWEGRGTKMRSNKIAKYEKMLKQSSMEEGMYHVENGTLFIDAGEPYLEHHGVKGMKWGKHLMAGKGEAGAGGGSGEDDEKLKEMAKKAGMSVAEYKQKFTSKIGGAASKVSIKDKHLVINGNRSSGSRGLAVGETGEKPKSFKEKAYDALGGKYKAQAAEAHREMVQKRNDADDKARRANAQGRAANSHKKAGNVREYMANKEGARQLDAEAKGARVSQWEATKKANSAQWKYDHSIAGLYDKATGKYKQAHKKTAIPKTIDRWKYEYTDGPNSKLHNNGGSKAKTAKEQAKASVWNAADHQIKAKEYNDVANSYGGNTNYYGQAYKNAAEREGRLSEASYRKAAALGKQASSETSTSSRPRARKKKHTSGGSGVTVRRPGRKPVSRTKRVTKSSTGVKRRSATGTGAKVRRGA